MKSIEELADEGMLMYGTESELVKQQLYDIIKEASIEARIGRQLVDVISMKTGTTLDFILADKDSMEFRQVAEGAPIPTDVEAYTKIQVTPNKWADQLLISQEIQEDANWDVVKRNLRQVGREAGVREDFIVFTAFNDSTNGFSSQTGHGYTSAGTEISIADIAGAMKHIEEHDYVPNVLAVHPEQVSELRQIDTFVEADKVGSRITFEKGFVGKIFGMDTVISTTTWVNQTSSSYAWILDTREAGVLVVRRPLTMKTYEIPEKDALGVACSFRAEARCVRPQAGVRITVS